MMFSIMDPASPEFAGVLSIGTFDEDLQRPEGLYFVNAAESPDGRAWLLIGDEESNATYAFALNKVSAPGAAAVLAGAAPGRLCRQTASQPLITGTDCPERKGWRSSPAFSYLRRRAFSVRRWKSGGLRETQRMNAAMSGWDVSASIVA